MRKRKVTISKVTLTCPNCLESMSIESEAGIGIQSIQSEFLNVHSCTRHQTKTYLKRLVDNYIDDIDSFGDWNVEKFDKTYLAKTFGLWLSEYIKAGFTN